MTTIKNSDQINGRYLAACLAWLRLRLSILIARAQSPPENIPDNIISAHAQAVQLMDTYEAAENVPPLLRFSQQFGLFRFEMEILLLCAAVELDTAIADLCARAHQDSKMTYPTFALAMMLFDKPAWDVMSPERPLRYWQLVETAESGFTSLTYSPLRIDKRILNYIKEVNYVDDRLAPLLTPLTIPGQELDLPPSQLVMVEQVLERSRRSPDPTAMPIIQLLGTDVASKHIVAWHAASAQGLKLYELPVEMLPNDTDQLERVVRLWQRESRLSPIALCVDAQNLLDEQRGPSLKLNRFLNRVDGLVFLVTRDVRQDLRRQTLDLDISKPAPYEQYLFWQDALGPVSEDIPARLTGQFNLNLPTIWDIAQTVQQSQPAGERSGFDRLWNECLVSTRPRLDTLAQRIETKATWDDVVLPEYTTSLLRQIVTQIQFRTRVYEDWGFRRRMNRGLGMVTLFAGESGTGKTMAAEVIANDLNLNLYRIDLSAVISKYIGETEKNLRQLFDAAEDGGAILFFDEADALFGKRSQVKDSHDRYANIETNYLLQRMEAYQGLAILATNMKSGLDEAFTRRLRFVVDFPVPQPEDRRRIWQKIFPLETPVGHLDYNRLAEFDLAGGHIYNVALNAAFLAAHENSTVEMRHVLNAIITELRKSDRIIDISLFS